MFVLQLPVLHELRRRGVFAPGIHCALRWFAEREVEAAAVNDAWAKAKEAGLVREEKRGAVFLDGTLARSLEILAEPLLRVRVVRVRPGELPLSTQTDSDGADGVAVLTDGREIVISPPMPLPEVVRGVCSVITGGLASRRGPPVDVVSGQALLLCLIEPAAESGTLTAEQLGAAVAEIGGSLSRDAAAAALDELADEGWLLREGSRYRKAPDRRAAFGPFGRNEIVDLVVTALGSDREVRRTHRFVRSSQQIWRVQPFVAGHDHPPPDGASDAVVLSTMVGLSYVPFSHDQVGEYVASLLRTPPPPRRRDSKTGVSLR